MSRRSALFRFQGNTTGGARSIMRSGTTRGTSWSHTMVNAQVASRTAVLLGTFLCFAQIGCTSSSAATPEDKDLESLKHAVAGFHDLSTAQQGGYTAVVGDPTDGHTCLSDPQEGGMGVHFLDKALVDDTVIVTRPEIVIYEPQQ